MLVASGKTVPSDLRPRWEMAKGKKSGLPPALTSNYNPTVRNAIIHGGVMFNVYDVSFKDKNGDEAKLSFSEAERLAQRLLNVCNGIAAALAESLVDKGTLVQQLTTWAPTETAAALASAPLLTPEAIYLSQYAELQAQMHGTYSHWRSDDLLFDLSRAALALHAAFPEADRYFLSFRPLDRGAPSFFTIPRSDIPLDRSSLRAIYELARTIMDGHHGMLWVDPPHLLAQLFSKTRFGRVLNWNQASDLGTSAINFELRELRNTSVDRKSRFEAYVVSSPREEDLDDEFHPTVSYLKDLFTQTGLRWLLRAGQRPFGVKHLRIFDFATIYVYAHDRPRQDLRGSGLPEYLMFRAQYGKNIGPPFLGSSWVKRGPFFVTMNPAGLSALKSSRQA